MPRSSLITDSPSPMTLNFRSQTGMVWILVIAALIVGGGFLVYLKYPSLFGQTNMSMNLKAYQNGKNEIASGNYDAAIQDFTNLLNSVSDKGLEGKTKILLGSSYLRRDQPGDEMKGIQLYKDVVSDYKVPANVRALALDT